MTITLLQGDNRAVLPALPEKSVQCVITSPPFYGLRDYNVPPTEWPAVEYAPMAGLAPIMIPPVSCCLGLESTPDAYIGHLVHVWRLLRRVLRDDGTCWLNLGDSYASTPSGAIASSGLGGGQSGQIAFRQATQGKSIPTGLKPKDLLGIPWRAAFALQADGWYLRSDVIWHKPNPMPESVTDRPTKAHEYVFLLAKGERYFYDADAVAETNQGDGRKRGPTSARTLGLIGGQSAHHKLQYQDSETGGTRNRRTVWSISTKPFLGAHFAVMPEALIEPCIKAGSSAMACEAKIKKLRVASDLSGEDRVKVERFLKARGFI
jgi:DNA modification methylase